MDLRASVGLVDLNMVLVALLSRSPLCRVVSGGGHSISSSRTLDCVVLYSCCLTTSYRMGLWLIERLYEYQHPDHGLSIASIDFIQEN